MTTRLVPSVWLKCTLAVVMLACSHTSIAIGEVRGSSDRAAVRVRRPVALVQLASNHWVIADRDAGTLNVLDLEKREVVSETVCGEKLTDLIALDARHLLAVDQAQHQLLLIRCDSGALKVAARIEVPHYPTKVVRAADGQSCYVSSLWSRRLCRVKFLPEGDSLRMQADGILNLPFAPREMLVLPEQQKLLVADAHGGQLAIVNPQSWQLEVIRDLPAHNIRGLALSPDGKRILAAHQIIIDVAQTTHNDVHWGVLMSNVLRWLDIDVVLDPAKKILADSHVHLAGDTLEAGGDPAGVAINQEGLAVVALAGVGQVGVGREEDYNLRHITVGPRPTAVAMDAEEKYALVANTLGGSVSIINLADWENVGDIPLGPQPELTEVQQGEQLFYNANLSLSGWFSCHSCHTDGHSNGSRNDNLGDDHFGSPKRILSLHGVGDTAPWAWNGQMDDLEKQISKSIRLTMRNQVAPTPQQLSALAAYVKSLPPAPGLKAAREELDDPAIPRGEQVFHAQGCINCHKAPLYTTPDTYDVGLSDDNGTTHFNPPSLRGVSQRGPFFHDNRSATLSDVLNVQKHGLSSELTDQQKADLVAFLESL